MKVLHIYFYTSILHHNSFFMASHKSSSFCGFSPSLRMITLNPLPLCSSRSHKYNSCEKATYIVSSNLCLFTCTQATGFPWNPYPQRHISAKGVSQIHSIVFGVNFSNNISIPQVRVNIKKTEHDTAFEIP